MFRTKYIFLLILPLLFLSCESVFLDMHDVQCNLNKSEYRKNEDIILSYGGRIHNTRATGTVVLRLQLEGTQGTETTSASIVLVDTGTLIKEREEFLYDNNKKLDAYIIQDSELADFFGKIKLRIDAHGDYVFRVIIGGATRKQYKGGEMEVFELPFSVMASNKSVP